MRINNAAGLSFTFLDNGSVGEIDAGPVRISLKSATVFSKAGMNIWLRKRSDGITYKALLGPESNSRFSFSDQAYIAKGHWSDLDYTCMLQLSKKSTSWQWCIDIKNTSDKAVEVDVMVLQDIGLKAVGDTQVNIAYVSQYLERRIIHSQSYGPVICCRQNMKEAAGNPWFIMACKNGAAAASTDGMQFYGNTCRDTGIPEGLTLDTLNGEYAGEYPVVAMQEKPFLLHPGTGHTSVFAATCVQDHPKATSDDDIARLPDLFGGFDEYRIKSDMLQMTDPVRNKFNTSAFFPVDDLSDAEISTFFAGERRHCEEHGGRLLSFFYGSYNHVVLHEKEIMVDRPHGHIMQAQSGFVPDENIISTTSFAAGVFNSHLSQGNTNFSVLLSVCSNPFNLEMESGQRILVIIDGQAYLLGVPSAFEMGLNHCRWIYKHGRYCLQVITWTSKAAPQVNLNFKVISGGKVGLIITHHFDAINHWKVLPGNTAGAYEIKPDRDSMLASKFPQAKFRMVVQGDCAGYQSSGDEALYDDNKNHGSSLFLLHVQDTAECCLSFIGEVCHETKIEQIEDAEKKWLSDCRDALAIWQDLSLKLSLRGGDEDAMAVNEILPWYGMNALTHFLTPYGLEQFSGAAWGTRDVAQGPFDLLLCTEKYEEAKQVLRIIFSNQNPDGGWPQWWMFDSFANIRADSAHGDIYYWCIIALSNYIRVTGDHGVLGEILPYYHKEGTVYAGKTSLGEHVDRLISMIIKSFIPGTALVPFGGGDWNDSLQPVSRELAQRMISSWTVEMNYQAFRQYQTVYEQTGNSEQALKLKEICERIKADFNRYLIRDGIVAGYGLTEDDGSISLLLHPGDAKTRISYSLLPMERGIISEIFTPEQAQRHLSLVEEHLKGPDGARLMDRPLKYHGGRQIIFQRAESSTFFGREIGLMYIHEHIRYAEAQARAGRADAFVKALRQAIPVGYRDVVPCGDFRQSNCYYSSSDVAFKNRYEADERYDEIKTGGIILKGGWRVYSSGPGIYISIIITRLLGIRTGASHIIIDPVMPYTMDNLSASLYLMGQSVTFVYSVKEGNHSPVSIHINSKPVLFEYEENPYRKGGAVIPVDLFLQQLGQTENVVEIHL
jgi:1,2-beta-oligoglucan phosphorylase